MIKSYCIFGISISVISWMIGIILNSILIRTKYYDKLSNMNFIMDEKLNEIIGLEYFKWIVKNTFFKFFNQSIKLENKNTDLTKIRKEMTLAETGHLIGFVFVFIVAVYMSIKKGSLLFGMIIMIINILMNLYPSLLQQKNKRRIDKLMNRHMKTITNRD